MRDSLVPDNVIEICQPFSTFKYYYYNNFTDEHVFSLLFTLHNMYVVLQIIYMLYVKSSNREQIQMLCTPILNFVCRSMTYIVLICNTHANEYSIFIHSRCMPPQNRQDLPIINEFNKNNHCESGHTSMRKCKYKHGTTENKKAKIKIKMCR